MTKKFTILTAAYNSSRYVGDWVKSIIAQEYRPLEVVVVNDCSTDDTMKIIKSKIGAFASEGIEIKLLSNAKRLFCGGAYKVALQNVTGDFFGVLDSDDMLLPDAVNFIMKLYNYHKEIAYIWTQFYICDVKMKKKKRRGISKAPLNGRSMIDMGKKHTFSHWRTFSKRIPNLSILFKDKLRSVVDKYLGYKLEEQGKGMFVDRPCYLYREGTPKGICNTEKTKRTWAFIRNEVKDNREEKSIRTFPIITCHKYE